MRGLGLLVTTVTAGCGSPFRQRGVQALSQLLPSHPCFNAISHRPDVVWLNLNIPSSDTRPLSSLSFLSAFQRRGVFGIGEESGDISKRHQERKLIGCGQQQGTSSFACTVQECFFPGSDADVQVCWLFPEAIMADCLHIKLQHSRPLYSLFLVSCFVVTTCQLGRRG